MVERQPLEVGPDGTEESESALVDQARAGHTGARETVAQDVAPLMKLTPLDGAQRTKHRVDDRGERLRAVDHEESRPCS